MDFAKPGFIWGVRPTTQKSRLPLIACEVAKDPTPKNAKSPRPKKVIILRLELPHRPKKKELF